MAELWCVHVFGPDTLIAQPDRETAEKRAHEWNGHIANRDKRHSYDPIIWCVPERWPYDAQSHAKAIAEHGGQPEDIC